MKVLAHIREQYRLSLGSYGRRPIVATKLAYFNDREFAGRFDRYGAFKRHAGDLPSRKHPGLGRP